MKIILIIVLILILFFLVFYNINEPFFNNSINSETAEINKLFKDFDHTVYYRTKIDFYKKMLDYIKNN